MRRFFFFIPGMLLFGLPLFSQTGDDWYEKALKENDNLRKVEYFTKAISAGKKDNWTYYYRGFAYLDLKKLGEAQKDFQTALTIQRGDIDTSFVLTGMAWVYYEQEQDGKALNYAERAIRARKDNAGAWSLKGWLLIRKKDYNGALLCFNEYLRLKPADSHGFADRAYTYLQLAQNDKALADCDAGLKLSPGDDILIQRKSLALIRMKRESEAVKLMESKVAFKGDDPISLMNIGLVFQATGEYEGAIAFHSQAIKLYDKKVLEDGKFVKVYRDDIYRIYLTRGDCYAMVRDYPKALADYTRASNYKPEAFDAWYLIAETQTQQKNWREAVSAYEKAYSIDPMYPEATGWINFGFCYGNLNQPLKAIDVYTRGIAADPESGLLWNNRGYTYLELKQYDKAKADLTKAVEVEPGLQMSHVSLGEYYYFTGEYGEAIQKLSNALDVKNKDEDAEIYAYFTRAMCWKSLKEWDNAIVDFIQTIKLDPTNARAWEFMGVCQYEKKDLCEAYKSLKKALEIDSRKGQKECTVAAQYLAKITRNPCI